MERQTAVLGWKLRCGKDVKLSQVISVKKSSIVKYLKEIWENLTKLYLSSTEKNKQVRRAKITMKEMNTTSQKLPDKSIV